MLKLITPALWAGLCAAVILSIAQAIWVSPLILQAEIYEQAAESESHSHAALDDEHSISAQQEAALHHHDTAERQADASMQHQHDEDSWSPEDGWQRHLATAGANLVMAVGFGMILSGVYWLRAPTSWRSGLLWGLAGYAVFFAAPSLGLPPELPGTAAAALESRQLWWLATAAATALGLALLVFAPNRLIKASGLAVLLAPQLLGAPQPEQHAMLAPMSLLHQFQLASVWVNALFWSALGMATAYFFRRSSQSARLAGNPV